METQNNLMTAQVLVVEDDTPIRQAIMFKLRQEGISAHEAQNGEEALARLKSGQYRIMLLDLLLPGKDGFAVLEEIKAGQLFPLSDIIIFSNLSIRGEIEKIQALGVKDFFIKSETTINGVVQKIKERL